MKKVTILTALVFCMSAVFAQQGWTTPNNSWGTNQNGINLKRWIGLPTGCGYPAKPVSAPTAGDSSIKKSGLYYDSCGHKTYIFDPQLWAWHPLDSTTGGGTNYWTAHASNSIANNNTGNVGVGTTTPGYKLEVVGDGYFSTFLGTGGNLDVAGDFRMVGSTGAIKLNGDYGMDGQILTSHGSGSVPTWETAAATLQGVINNGSDLSTRDNNINLGNGSHTISFNDDADNEQLMITPGVRWLFGDVEQIHHAGAININRGTASNNWFDIYSPGFVDISTPINDTAGLRINTDSLGTAPTGMFGYDDLNRVHKYSASAVVSAAVSQPVNQIVFGTGSGISSDPTFTIMPENLFSVQNQTGNATGLQLNNTDGTGRFVINNATNDMWMGVNIGAPSGITSGLEVTGEIYSTGNLTTNANAQVSGYHITPSDYEQPTTGSTVTTTTGMTIIDPAGAILALTIVLPSSPVDGQRVQYSFTQAVTTLSFTGGTLANPITTTAAGGTLGLIYGSTAGEWFKTN